ncbi:MAG: Phosphate transport system permease protein PstA [Bacteroidetes bacterium ADurb.Bin302]|nr:MAG: Phosphate transport system permease protein PstA [Bacteroidetes bacterium ADurb.Bin302]
MDNHKSKILKQNIVFAFFRVMALLVVAFLAWILVFLIVKGSGVLSIDFITSFPTDGMTSGGIFPAIIGTISLMIGSMIFAMPVGVLAGIYMNEYSGNGFFVRLIRILTDNLSSVPSIIFGLFGMALFVNKLNFGDSILAGSLTLGLLVLPIVIRTTEEALKAIEMSYREASLALGATRWQTIQKVVLPMAMPNIITGLVLSVGRVSGETAPILFTAAAYFLPKLPQSIFEPVMALPYHLYVLATSGTDIESARPIAYGTALVLIILVALINLTAALLRRYFSKKLKQ